MTPDLPPAPGVDPAALQLFLNWRNGMRQIAGLQERELVLDDGLRYAYLEAGHGEPLVLLHGFGSNKDNFVSLAPHLVRHHRLIVPDHIGFGDSTRTLDLDYRPSVQAERLSRFVRALGLGDGVHVAGSSMGGHIALAWARFFPAQVRSLWLLGPAGVWSAPPGAAMALLKGGGPNPLLPDSVESFRQLGGLVMHKAQALPEPLLQLMAHERIARRPIERLAFDHIRQDPIEPHLAGLPTPTLIVWGRHDQIVHPAGGEILQGLLPHSRLVMLDDVGHLPAIEAAPRVAQDYLAFRAELARA